MLFVVGIAVALASGLYAQGRGGRGGGAAAPQNAKAAAAFDLTGYWVSIVTEDWRYRMVTPSPGDYQGVPMTPEARKIADAWDPAKEEASGRCVQVLWSAGAVARTGTPSHHLAGRPDAAHGHRCRQADPCFSFRRLEASPGGPPTLQGDSTAEWVRGGGRGATDGSLKVTTSHLKAGFLRKNGVPYSENTTLTEYFDLIKEPNGDPLMVVTIVTTDPTYLRQPFVITSQYKKEASDAKWNPRAGQVVRRTW